MTADAFVYGDMSHEPSKKTLKIVVFRKPVSVNAAYKRAGFSQNRGKGGGKGFFMTEAGRTFKNSVRTSAFFAARSESWPKAETVKACSVQITTFNSRHDADAGSKIVLDALEGVIYANDRVVHSITCRKAKDPGATRVEIVVTLG